MPFVPFCCFPQAERERQELEWEREEQQAREEQEKQERLLADRAAELKRMKKEQLQEELDALRSGKVVSRSEAQEIADV